MVYKEIKVGKAKLDSKEIKDHKAKRGFKVIMASKGK
jgi:hypothetical protein